ncbi:MAG: hypothetical protein V1738_01690 [Patescibacteria group bacterium]
MKVERKIIGTTAVLLLIALAIAGGIIVPTVMRIRSLADELAEQQMEIERQYTLRSYAKQTLADIAEAQTKFDKVKSTSIIEGQELNFIKALEHAATISGVEQQINLETVNEVELTLWEREIPLKLRVQGPFPSVMSWLNEIEHLNYYVLFDTISISAQRIGGIADPQGKVDAMFIGRVFWLSKDAPYFLPFNELPKPTTEPEPEVSEKTEEIST